MENPKFQKRFMASTEELQGMAAGLASAVKDLT